MKLSNTIKMIAAASLMAGAGGAFSHIVLEEQTALAGTSYRAVLRLSHGCDGSPVTALRILIPAGFQGAKPMPKAGWVLGIKTARLPKPYTSHGKQVTDDVSEITWTASGRDHWVQDAWYEEFVVRGNLPAEAGPMWFKVLQTCDKGSIDWADVPASGTSTKGLKSPAALLEIIGSGSPAGGSHQH